MSYDLELYFSGICFFEMGGDPPTKFTVLLPNTTNDNPNYKLLCPFAPPKHDARLTLNASNVVAVGATDWEANEIIATPDGQDCAVFSLETKDLTLTTDANSRLKVERTSIREPAPYLTGRQDRSYNWLVRVMDLDQRLRGLGDTAPGKKKPAITRLQFDAGRLACFDLGRRRGRWLTFEFKTVRGMEAQQPRVTLPVRAIADRLVLRLNGLDSAAKISDGTKAIGIGPIDPAADKRERVRVSISHLERAYRHPDDAAFDFLWHYTLFEWLEVPDPEELVVPWPVAYREAGRTPSSALCPPGGG